MYLQNYDAHSREYMNERAREESRREAIRIATAGRQSVGQVVLTKVGSLLVNTGLRMQGNLAEPAEKLSTASHS